MTMPEGHKSNLESLMNHLPMVNWDRFTVTAKEHFTEYTVYGWIDREQDSYKDFIVLDITFDQNLGYDLWFTTSSAKYSAEIDRLLFGNEGNHEDCLRIEEHLDVVNAIKL